MNNIDILEDYIELIEKGYCEDCNELCNISKTPVYPSKAVAQAISNLIAENKELKEENEGLKTKLDTLIEKYKELKEELDSVKQIYYTQREIEENFIPKSKVKEKIKELQDKMNEDEVDEFGIHSIGWGCLDYVVEFLQSLLGKE